MCAMWLPARAVSTAGTDCCSRLAIEDANRSERRDKALSLLRGDYSAKCDQMSLLRLHVDGSTAGQPSRGCCKRREVGPFAIAAG